MVKQEAVQTNTLQHTVASATERKQDINRSGFEAGAKHLCHVPFITKWLPSVEECPGLIVSPC